MNAMLHAAPATERADDEAAALTAVALEPAATRTDATGPIVHSADPASPAFIKEPERRAVVCVISQELGGEFQLLWSRMHIKHGDPWFVGYREQLRRAGISPKPVASDLAEIQSYYASLEKEQRRSVSSSSDATAEDRAIHFLRAAQKQKASDLRLIMYRGLATLRYRRNGRGYHLATLTEEEGWQLANVIYGAFCTQHEGVALDPTRSQDAAIDPRIAKQLGIPEGRINTHPRDAGGHQLTIRLQAEGEGQRLPLEVQGFLASQLADFDVMLGRREGLVLFSGPMGSGKSTALIALAERLSDRDPGLDIITIEDPIEIRSDLRNVMQLPKLLPWEQEISSMVRQAADVLIPSEIRVSAAAVAAVDLASVGVMVMSTVHCNDVFAVPRRLIKKFGVDKETLLDPDMLTGMVHMRLVSRLCPHCKLSLVGEGRRHVTEDLLQRLGQGLRAAGLDQGLQGIYVTNPDGCSACRSIEAGRIAVAEVVVGSAKLISLLWEEQGVQRAKAHWIKHMGGITKTGHLLRHIRAGLVCPVRAEHDLWALDRDARMFAELEGVL